MKNKALRAIIEVGFIIFLFYANLLMGEFIHSGVGQDRGLAWAILNIFTISNFIIAVVAAFMGYIVFEYLRKKL
jgi:heme/copper-type cytochrome/quinol oxidase subunit 2